MSGQLLVTLDILFSSAFMAGLWLVGRLAESPAGEWEQCPDCGRDARVELHEEVS